MLSKVFSKAKVALNFFVCIAIALMATPPAG